VTLKKYNFLDNPVTSFLSQILIFTEDIIFNHNQPTFIPYDERPSTTVTKSK